MQKRPQHQEQGNAALSEALANWERARAKAAQSNREALPDDASLAKRESSNATKSFNISRRRHIDQIFRSETLTPFDKLIGFAISSRVNRQTGYTFAHPATLAHDIGGKFHEARRAVERLSKAGHLRSEERDHHVCLFPTPIVGAPAPVMPGGTKKFQRDLREWLHKIIIDVELTPGCRVAAYAIAALTDPRTRVCNASRDVLADLVHLSPKTIGRSIKSLELSGHIRVYHRLNSTPVISMVVDDEFEDSAGLGAGQGGGQRDGQLGGQRDGQLGGHSAGDSVDATSNSLCNPGNPGKPCNPMNVPTPSESAPLATRSMPTENLSYDEFQDIAHILISCARINDDDEGPTMSIAGIIRAGENLLMTISAKEIVEAVRWGLLSRNGKYATLTEIGENVAEGDRAAWDAWTRSGQSPGSRQP